MAAYTPNYGLHQWVGSDKFLRTDFNEDFAKIDAALGGIQTVLNQKADGPSTSQAISQLQARNQVVVGHYIGDGDAKRVIPLGFTPKAVLVNRCAGMSNSDGYGGLAVAGSPAGNRIDNWVEIVPGGFQVAVLAGTSITNTKDVRYNYLAVQ